MVVVVAALSRLWTGSLFLWQSSLQCQTDLPIGVGKIRGFRYCVYEYTVKKVLLFAETRVKYSVISRVPFFCTNLSLLQDNDAVSRVDILVSSRL